MTEKIIRWLLIKEIRYMLYEWSPKNNIERGFYIATDFGFQPILNL